MLRRKCASATFLTLGKSGNKTCRRYHGGANALTFCCLSDGFRIGFGPVRKHMSTLSLVRDSYTLLFHLFFDLCRSSLKAPGLRH